MSRIKQYLHYYIQMRVDDKGGRKPNYFPNSSDNIVGAMSGISGPKKNEIINRQLCHFFRADIGLGMAVAKGLGINAEDAMPKQHTMQQEPELV